MSARVADFKEELQKISKAPAAKAPGTFQETLELPKNVKVGDRFDCLEEEAVCTAVKELGCGSFGCVFKAKVDFKKRSRISLEDLSERSILQREDIIRGFLVGDDKTGDLFVAVKILKGESDPSSLASLLLEATVWASVPPHPNVVDLIHVEMLSGRLVFYSELVDGGDLSNAKLPGKGLTQSTALRMTLQLVAGVQHLHEFHLHHFDIKPANLLLSGDVASRPDQSQVKICDFGISQLDAPEQSQKIRKPPGLFTLLAGGGPASCSPKVGAPSPVRLRICV